MASIIIGTTGNDSLQAIDPGDTLEGLAGNDHFTIFSLTLGLAQSPVLPFSVIGGDGVDTLSADYFSVLGPNSTAENPLGIAFDGSLTSQHLLTVTGIEKFDIRGTQFDDTLTGFTSDDTLNGSGGNDQIFGHDGNDSLEGGSGNDTLDGGTGVNNMLGGNGDDTYIVRTALDKALESADNGTDLIRSFMASYALREHQENLQLENVATVKNGRGNAANNQITGNNFANVLNGLGGADTLAGGLGNDAYIVDNAGDVVFELAGQGIDIVQSFVTHTLGANLENMILKGGAAINGTGNSLNNKITGNVAANVLDGSTGADTMSGGKGNDTYHVDQTTDGVVELPAGGIDTILSSVTRSLGNNQEHLILTGTAFINGNGNALGNMITGNNKSNILNGLGGKDTLTGTPDSAPYGKFERDKLTGGTGADLFVLGTETSRFYDDRSRLFPGLGDFAHITDFNHTQFDRLQLFGNASTYNMAPISISGLQGKGLYHDSNANGALEVTKDELIAVFTGPTSASLTVANTINTAVFV